MIVLLVLALVCGLIPTGHAGVSTISDEVEIWPLVVPVSRHFGKQKHVHRNATLKILSDLEYEALCELGTIEEWRNYAATQFRGIDIIYLHGFGHDETCNGKIGSFGGGRYLNFFCSLNNLIILKDSNKKGKPGAWGNVFYHESEPDPECVYTFVQHYDMGELQEKFAGRQTLQVDFALDENDWILFLQTSWIDLVFGLVFPIIAILLIVSAIIRGYKRRDKLIPVHILILGLDVFCLSGFAAINLATGPAAFFQPASMAFTIFRFTQFFGLSVAGDFMLAVLYADLSSTEKQPGGNSGLGPIKRHKYVFFVGGIVIPLTEFTMQYCGGYIFSSTLILMVQSLVWPFALSIIQLGVVYIFWRNTVKMTSMVWDLSKMSTGSIQVNAIALAHRLKYCSKIICFSALSSLFCFGLFALDIVYWGPVIYTSCRFLFTTSRLLNAYSRLTSIAPTTRSEKLMRRTSVSTSGYEQGVALTKSSSPPVWKTAIHSSIHTENELVSAVD